VAGESVPYQGLRAFESVDRAVFFGRSAESKAVRELWREHRMLVVYGPSGVGKTSLVRAGVIPEFDIDAATVLPVGRVSAGPAYPGAGMPHRNPYSFALRSSWSPADGTHGGSETSLAEFLRGVTGPAGGRGDDRPLMAVIDQFEELFEDRPESRAFQPAFLDELGEAIATVPALRVLVVIREDALTSLLPHTDRLAGGDCARIALGALGVEAALEAVTGPPRSVGRGFAPGVAERLVDDLRTAVALEADGTVRRALTDEVEPTHLQIVCDALWRGLPPAVRSVTFGHLVSHAGVDETLRRFCAQAVVEVAARFAVEERELWGWLERTFITAANTRNTAFEGVSATSGFANQIARELERRHILRAEWRAGDRWYELVHDRLIEPVRAGNRPWLSLEAPAPDGRPALFLRAAESAFAVGDLGRSADNARTALALTGEAGETRVRAEAEALLGRLADRAGQPDEADTRLAAALELFDSLGDQNAVGRLLAVRGRMLLGRGRFADAAAVLKAALTRVNDPDARLDLARAFHRMGQYPAALAMVNQVLIVAPGRADALAERGRVLVAGPAPAEAVADLETALRMRPDLGADPAIRAALELARRSA